MDRIVQKGRFDVIVNGKGLDAEFTTYCEAFVFVQEFKRYFDEDVTVEIESDDINETYSESIEELETIFGPQEEWND